MIPHRRARRAGAVVLMALVLAGSAATAVAGGFEDEQFNHRFNAALSRFATFGDVAGVAGASAGSKWSTSQNPAATDWMSWPEGQHAAVTPQYTWIRFDAGTQMQVAPASVTLDFGEWGRVIGAFARACTNNETDRAGLEFDFDAWVSQVQWAKRIGRGSVGASIGFTRSRLNYDLADVALVQGDSESYSFRVGGLYEIREKLLAGLVVDYSFTRGRTKTYDVFGLGTGTLRVDDTSHQILVRPGLSYEYMENSLVFLDYQLATFWDHTGNLETHRFFLGVDHKIVEGLYARTGVNMDSYGSFTWGVGIGIYPAEWLSIDVGYQCNPFPELEPDFGKAHAITASISLSF